MDFRRGEDRAASARLNEDGASQPIRYGGGEGERLRSSAPPAETNELTNDVAMGNGASAIFSGTDRDLERARIVANEPDIGAA